MSIVLIEEQNRRKLTFGATIEGFKKFVEVWENDFNGWVLDFITPGNKDSIVVYLSKPER